MAKILIIDDDRDLRMVIRSRLVFRGYEVLEASDGEEGLRAARDRHPDLILCDVAMPLKDGFQVCRELRAEGNRVPIVFLTGKSLEQDQARGVKAGGDDYMLKPFEPPVLDLKIADTLRLRGVVDKAFGRDSSPKT